MATTHKLDSNGDGEPFCKYPKALHIEMESNGGPITKFETSGGKTACDDAFTMGKAINEGKTKVIYDVKSKIPGRCLVVSKDVITAWNGVMKNEMEGKAEMSTATNGAVMEILNNAGIKTAYIKAVSPKSFLAWKCNMIPIEWVARRIATGSFLKRNKGVKEGYRFYPPKMETFYKDDEQGDPQWSREVIEETKLECGGVKITPNEIDIMEKATITIFEILERVWSTKDVNLVDMKIEFGVRTDTNEIVLADVIDNDSWRVWPSGDKTKMKDKQVYRNLKEVTASDMTNVKKNYKWVADQLKELNDFSTTSQDSVHVAVVMGSITDKDHCKKIETACGKFGISCSLHVSSAHKSTSDTLKLLGKLEGQSITKPTVIIAVAGRSNGLGPVLSGNSALPIINCPPVSDQWGSADIWSSLRLPSGLACSTVLSPDGAALAAAQILAQHNFAVWGKVRALQLINWTKIKKSNDSL
uniref:Multifunctional protein ADE2-like n=1 Tax=Phallusia mammillata TaxID=59560 RepID=A0A6F9DMI1_9ASCI|nr:multifunctional protein ADE2-like [Phallusia mammillata]